MAVSGAQASIAPLARRFGNSGTPAKEHPCVAGSAACAGPVVATAQQLAIGQQDSHRETRMYKPLINLLLILVFGSLLCGVLFAGSEGALAILAEAWWSFRISAITAVVCVPIAWLNGRYGGSYPDDDDNAMGQYNTNGMPMLGATDVEGNAYGNDSSRHWE